MVRAMHRFIFLAMLAPSLLAAEWKAGVATAKITPQEPVWMSGYGSRETPSQGVAQNLYAKALAVEDPFGRRAVIVTIDLIGFSRESAERIAARVHHDYKLSRERVLLSSSHTHTGPAVVGNLPLMQPPTRELQAGTARYTRYLEGQVVAVIGAALGHLAPARLSYHIGRASFAMNRRERSSDGSIKLGDNPGGPVDHDAPALRIASPDGKLQAVLVSYAAHNTTLTGRHMELHGDYAGEFQQTFEKDNPGAKALFMLGCAGDANPGARGTIEHARAHGRELSDAVQTAISSPGLVVKGRLYSSFERFPIQLEEPPSGEEWRIRARNAEGLDKRIAQYFVERMHDGGPIPTSYSYPLQAFQLGDTLELIALSGEVTVGYALELKKRLGAKTTWVIGYANDVMAYIPTAKILSEGGYEAERSQMYYGMPGKWSPSLEETITERAVSAAARPGAQ